jgi:hypothetical protein
MYLRLLQAHTVAFQRAEQLFDANAFYRLKRPEETGCRYE